MASFRDWMHIEKPNNLTEEDVREAVKSMGKVANKRLKRLEGRDLMFDEEGPIGKEFTAGVRRFSVRGKDREALNREFTRVLNFLKSKRSTITGQWEMYKESRQFEYRHRMTKQEKKNYEKMKKQKESGGRDRAPYKKATKWEELKNWNRTFSIYRKLSEEFEMGKGTIYDSGQTQDRIDYLIRNSNLTDDEIYMQMKSELEGTYEERKSEETRQAAEDRSVSSFFSMGPSD